MRRYAALWPFMLLTSLLFFHAPAKAVSLWEEMVPPPDEITWQAIGQNADKYLVPVGDEPVLVRDKAAVPSQVIFKWKEYALRVSDYRDGVTWQKVITPGDDRYVASADTASLAPEGLPAIAVDYATAENGYVYVAAKGQVPLLAEIALGDKNHRMMLPLDETWQPVLLTLGKGVYTLNVYEAGIRSAPIRLLFRQNFYVENALADEQLALLSSLQTNIAENAVTAALAKRLCRGLTSDMDKVSAIWDWLYAHAVYDAQLDADLFFPNMPDADAFIVGQPGIDSDYTSFFAVALRAVDIPCKNMYGKNRRNGERYAWNEVYLEEKWQVVDILRAQTEVNEKFHTENAKQYGVEEGLWDGFQ